VPLIELPDGRKLETLADCPKLSTLADCRAYVLALSKDEQGAAIH
jgi:hypothetical protein